MRKLPKIGGSLIVHGALFCLIVLYFLSTMHMPLISTAGFEAANLFVLLFAPLYGLASTLKTTNKDSASDFRSLLLKELIFAAASIGLFTLLLTYNGFVRDSCSPGVGYFSFFMTLIPPILLTIALGSLATSFIKSLWLRIVFVILAYIAYFGFILASWWHETSFRVLTHLSLMLSSDLLLGGSLNVSMIAFRVATLSFAAAFIVFGYTFRTTPTTRIFKDVITHPIKNSFLIIFLLALGILLHWQSLSALGKNQATLAQEYSLSISNKGIVVRSDPNRVARIDAENILREALLYQKKIASLLPPRSDKPITIWLHPDDESKFLYTGAMNVHFALPHHREIHISLASIPHPVLGHELAHIYVGEYAQTILGLPGRFGIVPNMALTEGLAMYLTPALTLDNDLTLLEQAQGLFQAGFKVDIDRLFALNPTEFALTHPRSSYIFAGAFLHYAFSHSAKKVTNALEDVMSKGTLKALFASPEEQEKIENDFTRFLASTAPPQALRWAKNNFVPFSILGNNCYDPYRQQKSAFREACLNDSSQALTTISTIPLAERLSLITLEAQSLLSNEHYETSVLLLNFLLSQTEKREKTTLMIDSIDAHTHTRQFDQARSLVAALDPGVLNKAEKRQIAIAQIILAHPVITDGDYAILEVIFAKNATLLSRAARLGFELNHMENSQEKSIGTYLYARLLLRDKKYTEALPIIEQLKHNDLLPEALKEETDLMLAETYFNSKKYQESKDIYISLQQQKLSPATALSISDKIDRIDYALAH